MAVGVGVGVAPARPPSGSSPGSRSRRSARTQVKRFNDANSGQQDQPTEFQNDAYKTKIKTAIGAGQGPTLIWGWGGGGLKSYVEAGQVEDLTGWFGQNPDEEPLLPVVLRRRDGRRQDLRAAGRDRHADRLYYNKTVFEKVGRPSPPSRGPTS